MAQCTQRHMELGPDGVGLCSKPMWDGWGMEAGFCDKPAYGPREPGAMRGGTFERGQFQPYYIPGLACYHHPAAMRGVEVK